MNSDDLASSHPNILSARERSRAELDQISRRLPSVPPNVCVIMNGSLARREITSSSDLDAYPVYRQGSKQAALRVFDAVRQTSGLRSYAKDGAFGAPVMGMTIPRRIGGQGDDNKRFTRRMLLLLESGVVGGDVSVYRDVLDRTIFRYLNDDITDKQIGRFLVNDIIRFYRQMCVDFEFKTVEQQNPKPWGVRYVKLIFSRKLIYYSGLVMCAELAGMKAAKKRDTLRSFIEMSPVDRLLLVMDKKILPALDEYDAFLELLHDPGKRAALSEVEMLRETHTDAFREVKVSGHRFSSALVGAFRSHYSQDHPIREAVLV